MVRVVIISYSRLNIMVVTTNACSLVFRDKRCTYNVIVFRVCLTIASMVSKSVFSLYF